MSRFFLCCLLFALPAAAQLDSAALRAKFGTPTVREIFHRRPGFDIVVDYGANHQVCRMEMPTSLTRGETDRFLEEIVPDSMRGKEVMARIGGGLNGSEEHIYERMAIAVPGPESTDTTVTVWFKNEACKP